MPVTSSNLLDSASSRRADVEGLRGVAILLVVLFHANVPGWSGGFVGVDVFFVLSGFLITGLLLREHEATGRIAIVDFYARRARRLLPACALTVAVTLLAAGIILAPIEQRHVSDAAVATAVYASNLFFLRAGTDYFGHDTATNPFLHAWSLSLEEQFYLVWPGLILLTLGASAGSRRFLGLILAALSLVSLIACIWLTYVDQRWAFFATPLRAWQFGFGALVNWLSGGMVRPVRARVAGWVGLAVITGSGMALSGGTLFPGLASLLPTGGAVAVLAAGTLAPGSGAAKWLSSSWLQFLGKHSYSWYLWHWPVIVLAAALFPAMTLTGRLACMVLALGLAVVTYVVLERRVRYSPFLAARPVGTLVGAVGVTVFLAGMSLSAGSFASRVGDDPTQRQYAQVTEDQSPLWESGCMVSFRETALRECVLGDSIGEETVVLFGDSHAAQWSTALHRAGRDRNWRVVAIVKSACPAPRVPVFNPQLGREERECDVWREKALDRIVELQPAAVVVASAAAYIVGPGRDGGYARLTYEEWERGMRSTLESLDSAGLETLLLRDTPTPGFDVPICLARAAWRGDSSPINCAFDRSIGLDTALARAELEASAGLTRITPLDLSASFCDDLLCQPVMGGHVVYHDEHHVSASFAESLAAILAEGLERLIAQEFN